jgi:Phosphodiester glycosidase
VVSVLILSAALLFAFWRMPTPRWMESWPEPADRFGAWQPLFAGVEYAKAAFHTPRPMKCHALRIDLKAQGITFALNPPLEDGRVRAYWPSDFLRANGCQVVVNTTPFTPETPVPGVPVMLQGLGMMGGIVYSKAAPNLDAMVIDRDGSVRVVSAQADLSGAKTGFGGFLITLKGGVVVGEELQPDAASTAGVSADGRYLYWLVVDGRQPGYSEGATPKETANMLLALGASDGINFDGGSSAVMVVAGGLRGAKVLNRPCSPMGAGWERPVGGLLGVYARQSGR